MEKVKCPKCGKEKIYNENAMQICWECNQIMTSIGLPETIFKCIKNPMKDYGCFVDTHFPEVDNG